MNLRLRGASFKLEPTKPTESHFSVMKVSCQIQTLGVAASLGGVANPLAAVGGVAEYPLLNNTINYDDGGRFFLLRRPGDSVEESWGGRGGDGTSVKHIACEYGLPPHKTQVRN